MDTCCISDRDLVERSQAINTMFNWYKEAEVCYAFLLDVSDDLKEREAINKLRKEQNRLRQEEDERCDVEDRLPIEDNYLRPFEKSEWFTRGWTLQELLAPKNLHFFDHRWQKTGDKQTRSIEIQSATKIEADYLKGNFTGACLAVRMSWAASRRTTIRDDMAYCMLGIFGINMGIRYGENEKAFLRLQEKLVENFDDESIFAWTIDDAESSEPHGLLAPWPSCFARSDSLTIKCPNLLKQQQQGRGYSVQKGETRGIEFKIPGRLVDHGNSVELNTLIANRRSSYKLGINCWKASEEEAGSVTIDLAKDAKGYW
jgi:Heterokaryon incompatibility protein (HET)